MIKNFNYLIIGILIAVFLIPTPLLALEATGSVTSSASLKVTAAKEKIRNSVQVRYEVYQKALQKEEALLVKMRKAIKTAKDSGKDVVAAEKVLLKAEDKLTGAEDILAQIAVKKDTAVSKSDYTKIHNQFLSIGKTLNAVKLQLAKSNSALKSAKALLPEKSATRSATQAATKR